jgi:hypothetical protein
MSNNFDMTVLIFGYEAKQNCSAITINSSCQQLDEIVRSCAHGETDRRGGFPEHLSKGSQESADPSGLWGFKAPRAYHSAAATGFEATIAQVQRQESN